MRLSPVLQDARKRFGVIEFKAVIGGDASGNCDVPGFPGYVYVQIRQTDGLSDPIPARWQAVCPKVIGQPIDVGYDKSGQLSILRADFDGQVAVGINPLGNNPADKNVSNFINQSQITTLLSHVVSSASASMLVTVEPYIYIKNGIIHWFLGGDGDGATPIDLTAYIPATPATQCMAGLFLKDDDLIEVQVSSNIPASDPLWLNEAQECLSVSTRGSSFVWAYHLYYGQTTIVDGTKDVGGDTVLDFRQIVTLWSINPNLGAGVISTLASGLGASGIYNHLILAAESGTTDDCIEVTGLNIGDEIIVRADTGDTITLKNNDAGATDKIFLAGGGDLALSGQMTVKLCKVDAGVVVQYQ